MAFLNEKQLELMGFKYLGNNVRISEKASIYSPEQIEIGDHSRIDDFCVISGKVIIGRNVHIAVFCNVAGGEKGATLEDFSGLAYGCHVFTQSDDYGGRTLTNPTVPDKYKREIKKEIVIGRHSIVGTNSLIFPGVVLAEGTSVGALSMVTKSTEEWSVYLGNPAKRLKARKRDLLKLEKEYLTDEGQNKIT
ncbi:MAG: acyltransferase [Verrucomicrobia bacterium]|jgi:acetyltransferase-like isoleucine patch superfamily enzyme|nr:acyltransferase [Verrucomicrobiota bacterium]MBT6239739.1 acyltransferase [Verrucomicrobiota bacterium]MBT6805490.1 acyltransferase [Verrucomicrobiota bacterium]MBT7534309.1 acyltransferase [Verrucomicrobiota bacterium]MBT7873203.1 acyltransferase [Verrucomicrobiota bacterium]